MTRLLPSSRLLARIGQNFRPNPRPQKISTRVAAWRQTGIDWAAYAFVRLLIALVGTMPTDMGDSLCRLLGNLAAGPLGIRRRITELNVNRCFPEATPEQKQQLARAMWHHLLLMTCEIAWAQRRLHLCNWSQHVRFRDNRVLLRHLLSRRPVVLVTGHFGNFEIGGYVIGLMGFSTTTIARRLDNRFLHEWVEGFRAARGQLMVDKHGCAPAVDRHLQSNGTLSLLADQHAGDKGCWVNFLGVPASSHKALALFSLSSGAPMVVGYTRRIDGMAMRFESGCVAVADPHEDDDGVCDSVTTLTQWYNGRLAEAISMAPEQYWWLHRRWREPPPRIAQRLEKQNREASAARAA